MTNAEILETIENMKKGLEALKAAVLANGVISSPPSPGPVDIYPLGAQEIVKGPDDLGRVQFMGTSMKYPKHWFFAPWVLKAVRRTDKQVAGISVNCSCSPDGTSIVPGGPMSWRWNGNFSALCYNIVPATGERAAAGQLFQTGDFLPTEGDVISIATKHLNFNDFIAELNKLMK